MRYSARGISQLGFVATHACSKATVAENLSPNFVADKYMLKLTVYGLTEKEFRNRVIAEI